MNDVQVQKLKFRHLYLRARGIPKKEAKALLTFAFANNVLESVNILSVKSRIKKIIANKLGVDLGFDL